MARRGILAAWGLIALSGAAVWAAGRPVRPSTYELSINGEQFTVEADRQQTLTSRKSPGVKYEVALRVAPAQRLALKTLELAYDRGFAVTIDDGQGLPTASLQHELGFSVIISDLGKALAPEDRKKYQASLVEAMKASAAASAKGPIEVSPPAATDATGATGEVVVLRYRDNGDLSRALGVYVLNVGKSSCSVVVQMLDDDAEDAQPMIEAILDSLREKRK